jgi:type I restriction enzyme, S subunit
MKTSTSVTGDVRQWRRYSDYQSLANASRNGTALPKHWAARRLKFVAPAIENKLPRKPTNCTYVGLENIESHTGRLLLDAPIEQVDSTVSRFIEDDILFGKLRPYLAKVVLAPFTGVCSTEILVLRPLSDAIPQFLKYQLLSEGFIKSVDSATYGVKMPRANSSQVGDVRVSLPPPDEQRCVVAFLDQRTAKIDALIAKKEQLIELLQEKRTALISHAVTKGLDRTVPMKDSGIRWIGSIPHHWRLLPVRRIAKRVDVGIAEASTHAYRDTGIPIIRSTNVRRNHIDKSDLLFIDPGFAEKNRSKYLSACDLLTTRTGANLGMTAIVPPDLDQSQCFTLLVTTLRSGFAPRFFCYFMNSSAGQFYFSIESWGAGQHNLSVPIIQEMPVPVPPLEEQTKIVQHVMRVADLVDPVVAKIRDGIDKLSEYRTALISAAVTGKIDVREEP